MPEPTLNDPADGPPPTRTTSPSVTGPMPITAYFSPPQGAGEVGRFAHYKVVKQLGEGGMGLVFLAEDTRLERPVALKFMAPGMAVDPKARARFLREARTAAKVAAKNKHVVTIFEAHEEAGLPYIAMERLKGLSLEDYLVKKGIPGVGQVLRIGREVAAGLQAAHELKLVHRDIKPSNIWLESPNGNVKLLDFGLALEATGADSRLTVNGAVVGTPEYMPPEQARGEEVDHRADLYSLGVVLYQLATGERPFARPSVMAVLGAVLTVDPPPIRAINPGLPAGLEDLIRRLMAKDPAARPQTAAEVIEALSGAAATDSIADVTPAGPLDVPARPPSGVQIGGRPPSGVARPPGSGAGFPGSGAYPPGAAPVAYPVAPTATGAAAPTHFAVPPGSHPPAAAYYPPPAAPVAAPPPSGASFAFAPAPPPPRGNGLGIASIVCGVVALCLTAIGCCLPTYFLALPLAVAGGGMGLFARGGERVAGVILNAVALIPAAIMMVLGAAFLGLLGLGAAVSPTAPYPTTRFKSVGEGVPTKVADAAKGDPYPTGKAAPYPTTPDVSPKAPEPTTPKYTPPPTSFGFPTQPTAKKFGTKATNKGFSGSSGTPTAAPDVEKTLKVDGAVPAWERGMEITLDRVELLANFRMRWHFTLWNKTGVRQQFQPNYPRYSVAIDDKGNRCNGLEDVNGMFGKVVEIENGEKVTYWFDFQRPAADATSVTANLFHSLKGKLPKLTVQLSDGKLLPVTPNLVLKTKFPILKGVDAWVELDGVKKADWPVGTSQVDLLVPAGNSHRVAVYSLFQGQKRTIHDRYERIPDEGKREIDVGQ